MAFLGLASKKEYDKLARELDALKKNFLPYERWQLETADAERYNLPDPSVYDNQADLFRKLSWVLQAVDLVASGAAMTPFRVARIVAGKEPKDIPNHEFEMLMRHPNPHDSRYEFLYATIAFWMLNGNAYWWLNRKDEYSQPDELWAIPPSMIIPVPDEKMYLKGYLYYPGNGMEIFMQTHEIVHFRRFNPRSRFLGLSAVESIALVAYGDIGMQDWNTRLFSENNARLPGILTFEQFIEQGTWDKIMQDTREASKKRELLMLRGVGQGGVKWMQNAVSQKEMEFLSGRKFNAKEIMDTLAPGSYTMMYESATEANSRTGRATLNELSIYPKHILMSEKITNNILSAYPGRPLIGQFEDIRVTDRKMELDEQTAYSKSHTIGEIREKFYGDPPLSDERDDLFPEQIKAASGGVQESPVPTAFGVQPEPQREMTAAENKPPQEQKEDDKEKESAKAVLADLARMERKAVKHIGKAVDFLSDNIPPSVLSQIKRRLPACKDTAAVRAVFSAAKRDIKPQDTEAAAVIKSLYLAISQLESE